MRRAPLWLTLLAALGAPACSALITGDTSPFDTIPDVPDVPATDLGDVADVPMDSPDAQDDAPDALDVQDDAMDAPDAQDDVADADVVADVVDEGDVADVPATRCVGGCDDGVACTDDRCDEAEGRCVHTPDNAACMDRQVCDVTMGCTAVACTRDADCDNMNACDGVERCAMNRCVPGTPMTCDDGVACTDDRCDPATGRCAAAAVDARCDDGIFCNGAETCDVARGCAAGAAVVCDDSVACTDNRCDESMRRCVYLPNPSRCEARGPCVAAACSATGGCQYTPVPGYCDSFCISGATCNTTTGRCEGGGTPRDCSDTSPCTNDRCDPAASMCRHDPIDADGDGAPARMVSGAACAGGTDCNDADPRVRPGATEVCNGVDDDCDGMVDNIPATACTLGPCAVGRQTCFGDRVGCGVDRYLAMGTMCRAAGGVCEAAATCTGASADCPTNPRLPSTTVCRVSTGPCDPAETCSGASAGCPADQRAANGTVCRASAGVCDIAETCNGRDATCPADGVARAGTVCRFAAGFCDVNEACTGASADCPANAFVPAGRTCRAAAGACDVAEACSGASADCPADAFAAATTVCRMTRNIEACDPTERCTGTGNACPADVVVRAPTMEVCDGVDNNCNAMVDEGLMCTTVMPGENCTSPLPIDLASAATAMVTVATMGRRDDFDTSCAMGNTGNDLVYAVTAPVNAEIVIEATTTSGTNDPLLSVRDTCGGAELACNDDVSRASRDARIWIRPTGTGAGTRTFYVVADSYGRGASATFTLRFARSAAIGLTDCTSTNFLDVTRGGTVLGYIASTNAGQSRGSCSVRNADEDILLYSVPTGGARVNFDLRSAGLVNYVRQGACSGTGMRETNCSNGPNQFTANLAAGRAWVFVDDIPTSPSSYVLQITPQ